LNIAPIGECSLAHLTVTVSAQAINDKLPRMSFVEQAVTEGVAWDSEAPLGDARRSPWQETKIDGF
jgi:hypothetical protein